MKKRLFLRASNYMFSLQNRIKRLKVKNVNVLVKIFIKINFIHIINLRNHIKNGY